MSTEALLLAFENGCSVSLVMNPLPTNLGGGHEDSDLVGQRAGIWIAGLGGVLELEKRLEAPHVRDQYWVVYLWALTTKRRKAGQKGRRVGHLSRELATLNEDNNPTNLRHTIRSHKAAHFDDLQSSVQEALHQLFLHGRWDGRRLEVLKTIPSRHLNDAEMSDTHGPESS